MVSVIQTFGDRINPHHHVHALVSRGGWTRGNRFMPIPYVDPTAAEKLFRHEVFAFLLRDELISHERVELLPPGGLAHAGADLEQEIAEPPAAVALRTRWADLLRRVYEIDPLVCPRCSARMKAIGFITQTTTIKRILEVHSPFALPRLIREPADIHLQRSAESACLEGPSPPSSLESPYARQIEPPVFSRRCLRQNRGPGFGVRRGFSAGGPPL